MKQTVSIHRIAKWDRRQEAFMGWSIKDQEETNTKYLALTLALTLLISNFNILLSIQPPPFADIIALHPVQISFDSSVAFSVKATSTIFTRASVSFDLHNMRKAKSWVFVSTDCLYYNYTGRVAFIQKNIEEPFELQTLYIHLPPSQYFLKGSTHWEISFLFSHWLFILIFHGFFKGCIPCFNSHF